MPSPTFGASEPSRRSASPWFAIALSVGIHVGLIAPALFLRLLPQAESLVALTPTPVSSAFCVQLGTMRHAEPEPVNTSVPSPVAMPEPPAPVLPVSPAPLRLPSAGTGTSAIPAASVLQGTSHSGHGGTGGGHGPATFLKAPVQARSVVYVLDRSLSMGLNGALELATNELLAGLAELPETTRFQVILYNRIAVPMRLNDSTALQPATEENRLQVAEKLAGVLATDDTDHVNALKQALVLQPDVIFLVTDGDGLSPADVAQLTRINHGRCSIHTVEVRTARVEEGSPLRQLAAANRGTYQVVSPAPAVASPAPPGGSTYSWPQSSSGGR